jgi:hypothetical protein
MLAEPFQHWDIIMSIDPKMAIWLNVLYAALVAIGTGGTVLFGNLDPATVKTILAWAGVGATLLNFVLHGYSAPAAGPMVPPK